MVVIAGAKGWLTYVVMTSSVSIFLPHISYQIYLHISNSKSHQSVESILIGLIFTYLLCHSEDVSCKCMTSSLNEIAAFL